jgi:exosortase A-associated hydrolase 2
MAIAIKAHAEFYQGAEGKIFRLIRTPSQVNGHVIYIAPLFEQANKTRHMLTRSAINTAQGGLQSIVFDHFGTGDSAGELLDANLALWQQDIVAQIKDIKSYSEKPVFLSVLLSAALLLDDAILSEIDGLLLIQADFNGKSFIRQLKRLAVAGNLIKPASDKGNDSSDVSWIDIAGYQLSEQLLDELAKQDIRAISSNNTPCTWFEWLTSGSQLTPSRIKQQQAFQQIYQQVEVVMFDDNKYWQAIELQLAPQFLTQEQQAILQLIANHQGARAKLC